MSTQAVTSDVAQYATTVREHLADLTARQVEDAPGTRRTGLQDALDDRQRRPRPHARQYAQHPSSTRPTCAPPRASTPPRRRVPGAASRNLAPAGPPDA